MDTLTPDPDHGGSMISSLGAYVVGGTLAATALGDLLRDPAVHAMLTPLLGALGGFLAALLQAFARKVLGPYTPPSRRPQVPRLESKRPPPMPRDDADGGRS
jgi:hypothetical protein